MNKSSACPRARKEGTRNKGKRVNLDNNLEAEKLEKEK